MLGRAQLAQSYLWLPHLCQNCHLCTKNEIFYTILHTTVLDLLFRKCVIGLVILFSNQKFSAQNTKPIVLAYHFSLFDIIKAQFYILLQWYYGGLSNPTWSYRPNWKSPVISKDVDENLMRSIKSILTHQRRNIITELMLLYLYPITSSVHQREQLRGDHMISHDSLKKVGDCYKFCKFSGYLHFTMESYTYDTSGYL